MRRAVAVLGVVLAACSSTPYWMHTQSSDLVEEMSDGSEVLLITHDRAVHLADARVRDGFVSGQAEHVWKISAGTKVSTTDTDSRPVDLAHREKWLELADDPGPVAISTIRFARVLNAGGGAGKGVFLTLVVIGAVIGVVALASACGSFCTSGRPD